MFVWVVMRVMYEKESEGKLWERLATKWIAKPQFESWVPGGHRADLVKHKADESASWWLTRVTKQRTGSKLMQRTGRFGESKARAES